jgi:hypothetical protein
MNAMPTKKNEADRFKDTLRAEYDMRGGVRGKYASRFTGDVRLVALEPDVAKEFVDAEAVNNALRVILKSAKKTPAGKRRVRAKFSA